MATIVTPDKISPREIAVGFLLSVITANPLDYYEVNGQLKRITDIPPEKLNALKNPMRDPKNGRLMDAQMYSKMDAVSILLKQIYEKEGKESEGDADEDEALIEKAVQKVGKYLASKKDSREKAKKK